MGDEKKTITVAGTGNQKKDGSWPVALWERDDQHPNGEVFIAGPDPVEVAQTPAVAGAISSGDLKVVGKAPAELKEAVDAGKEEIATDPDKQGQADPNAEAKASGSAATTTDKKR